MVADTGIGIAIEDQEKIFEELFKVRGPLQARRMGSGLGLPYVQRLAEVLNGELDFQSAVGVGTRVTVCVPLRWAAMSPTAPSSDPAAPTKVDTVVIVDDDESSREVLRGMLQGVARRVIEAGEGAEALTALQENLPDLVFLDLRMPELDEAAEPLSRMAEGPSLRSVPTVIFTSGKLDSRTGTQLGGASAMLAKSGIDRDRILEVLVQVLKDANP